MNRRGRRVPVGERPYPGIDVIVILDGVEYTAFVHAPDSDYAPIVVEVRRRCCPAHNRRCEPPSELCCDRCREAEHPQHGSTVCDAPDLGGGAQPNIGRRETR